MKSVEMSAKTRQEAIKKALEALGAELHEAQIEILDEGSRGLFGLGARDVKVRISVDRPDDREEAPRREPRGDRNRPPRPERKPRPEAQQGPREDRPKKEDRPPREDRPKKEDRPPREDRPKKEERPPRAERPKREERPPRDEKRRPERPAPKVTPPEDVEEEEWIEEDEGEDAAKYTPVPEERREEAAALLAEIVNKMGIQATVTSSNTEEGCARLNIQSEDSAIIIGRKGRSLQSLQYLMNRIMSRSAEEEANERFLVDVEDYLVRRRQSLEEMATELARKAKETNREVRVKPLNPQERRVVHVTLQGDPELRTFSLGTGPLRTIVISPKTAVREGGRSRRPSGERSERSERSERGDKPEGERSGQRRSGGRGGRGGRGRRRPRGGRGEGPGNGQGRPAPSDATSEAPSDAPAQPVQGDEQGD